MEEKICPYCYKSIQGNYGTVDKDLVCPHSDCRKIIPRIYLQYPSKQVVSIVLDNTCDFKDFGYEVANYAINDNPEETTYRVEYYDSGYEKVRFILYEYLKEESSLGLETVVLVFHFCVWRSDVGILNNDIQHASAILLNLDISELKSLYFNLGIDRSIEEFEKWNPVNTGKFVREVSYYLRKKQINSKVAILFGNLQYLIRHPYVSEDKRYMELMEIIQDWTGSNDDRKRLSEANTIIRDLLMELGEERFIHDADSMPNLIFFLFPSSEYRMVSNTFWIMAVLLWICTKTKIE